MEMNRPCRARLALDFSGFIDVPDLLHLGYSQAFAHIS